MNRWMGINHSAERTKSDLKVRSFFVTTVIGEMAEPSAKHRGQMSALSTTPAGVEAARAATTTR